MSRIYGERNLEVPIDTPCIHDRAQRCQVEDRPPTGIFLPWLGIICLF